MGSAYKNQDPICEHGICEDEIRGTLIKAMGVSWVVTVSAV